MPMTCIVLMREGCFSIFFSLSFSLSFASLNDTSKCWFFLLNVLYSANFPCEISTNHERNIPDDESFSFGASNETQQRNKTLDEKKLTNLIIDSFYIRGFIEVLKYLAFAIVHTKSHCTLVITHWMKLNSFTLWSRLFKFLLSNNAAIKHFTIFFFFFQRK